MFKWFWTIIILVGWIFMKCLDFRSSSEADSLNFFNFLCKKTSAVEIHRLQLMIDVIADRHQEILGIYIL